MVQIDDRLAIMYNLIKVMSKNGYPVVFKGAMVLKHIMYTNQVNGTERMTKDIDADWLNLDTSMEQLTSYIEKSVNSIGVNGLSVRCIRERAVGRSAGYEILYKGQQLFSFDISFKMNNFATLYRTYDGYEFYGNSKEKIFVDKMSAISTQKVFRRCKDVYDLYLLSMLNGIYIQDIVRIIDTTNTDIGEFSQFIYEYDKLKYAYSRMRNIKNPPEFDIIYSRVRDFCMPFISKRYIGGIGAMWEPKSGMWVYTM